MLTPAAAAMASAGCVTDAQPTVGSRLQPAAASGSRPLVLCALAPDPRIARVFWSGLGHTGMQVAFAASRAEAIHLAQLTVPDCVVLDAVLDDADLGLHTRLRAATGAPTVFLTTDAPGLKRRLDGLEAAAVLAKPIQLGELTRTIRQLLSARRRAGPPAPDRLLAAGGVTMDLAARTVRVDGTPVRLPRSQFDLLRALLARTGQTLPAARLTELAWGPDHRSSRGSLTSAIAQLRKLVDPHPPHPMRIVTVRGAGYRLEAVPTAQPTHTVELLTAPGRLAAPPGGGRPAEPTRV